MIDEQDNSMADVGDAPAAEGAAPAPQAEPRAAAEADPSSRAARGAAASQVASSADPSTGQTEGGPTGEKHWYILKVQSNREDSIRDALLRRIAVAGLQDYFDEIIVPIETVAEFKNGKKRVVKRKLYPGYIVVHMELNEDTWFLVRETPGIGDFTGSGGKPTPMQPHDVNKIVAKAEAPSDETVAIAIPFDRGDRVKIKEGTFENFEGEVDAIDRANGRVTVMINIFGRSTPVELEYWQIEPL